MSSTKRSSRTSSSNRSSSATEGRKRARTALFDVPDWSDTLAVRAMRLGDTLVTRMTALLSPFGITPLQYNVLRILYVRDEAGEGLPIGVIGGALIAFAPDVSRLIDRLEKLGHLERVRKSDDRRVVRVRLTDKGFALVEQVHHALVPHHHSLFAKLPKRDVERISADLARVFEALPKSE